VRDNALGKGYLDAFGSIADMHALDELVHDNEPVYEFGGAQYHGEVD
jgi:hypothetical protein